MAELVIRQFDVYRTPRSRGSAEAPLICVLQSHYLDALNTVVVAPLLIAVAKATTSQAAVPIVFDGTDYLLDTSLMANIERRGLGRPVGSLLVHEDEIRRALDRLFTGF